MDPYIHNYVHFEDLSPGGPNICPLFHVISSYGLPEQIGSVSLCDPYEGPLSSFLSFPGHTTFIQLTMLRDPTGEISDQIGRIETMKAKLASYFIS
jgi:hypothetical protein